MSSSTIVILGAGYAGLSVAQKLLKTTLPQVEGLKVVLVTPNTHFYWNLAAVRAVIPGAIKDDAIFAPIEPGFSKYSSTNFEFVLGAATGVDPVGKSVHVKTNDGQDRHLQYDHLVIATGAAMSASNMPFKLMGTTEETKQALHDVQKRISSANNIVIAGGGATGVETAGEIAENYGSSGKNITLVTSAPRLLSMLSEKVSTAAESTLTSMGVKVICNVRVTSHDEAAREVILSSGGHGTDKLEKLSADLYLPLYGVKPNTSFLPASWLTATGDLKLTPQLRTEMDNSVWGIGDVANIESKQAMKADPQSVLLAQNLHAVLTGKTADVKDYAPSPKPMMAISIGKKSGTGEMFGMRMWGWFVSMVKGKTLLIERLSSMVANK